MKWLTEHSIWVLLGLVIFMAIWFVAFFARNHQAKRDQTTNDKSHLLDRDTKDPGTSPIKKTDKL